MNPLFPSILSTNFFNLEAKLREFETSRIDFIHLDVMDGHFVDTISFGPGLARALKEKFRFRLDAHLMVSNPDKAIPHFIKAGVDWLSFHSETCGDTPGLLKMIRDGNCRAGLALNPDTPLEQVRPFLSVVDYILVMSVFPGYGGQQFIASSLERVALLKREIISQKSHCLLQVDGGINVDNVGPLKEAGADLFVVGTSLFNSDNIEETVKRFLNQMPWSQL
ncbi:MAG: ribulose-phosphate 3-epimerase [Chrysiogenales bacterium]|nr:MAG: ribulose-phosphate 3-epimerase [Chrysiogenales bacterium]